MSKEESPYCEICGHCGDIGCCGIINFVENHIKGKTNCKNEDSVIKEIIDICDYETEVFNENEKLKQQLQAYKEKEDKIRELITAPIDGMSLDRLGRDILQILNEGVK